MNTTVLQNMVEQATAPELPKTDMVLNKKICQLLRDDESLYKFVCLGLQNRTPEMIRVIRSRLVKKNPQIQCLALDLLDVTVRNCPGLFHQYVATEEFMSVLAKLLKVPGVSPVVTLL